MNLLALTGVAVTFPARRRGGQPARAVDGVDLDIADGEVVALVGESGSGKTTLARAILGLQQTSAGTISFDGQPLPTDPAGLRSFRRAVQIVFQDPNGSLNPRHTVYDIVAEGLRVQGAKDREAERVAAALERCGLRPADRFVNRFAHELSGGQRQRVLIAGALVLEPRLLIADEPVSSLDASVRGEILQLLLGLARDQGMTIVVVTHDLGLAWNIADRVAVMYLGRIVEQGPTEEVLSAPTHPYTRALLSVVPETGRLRPEVLTGESPDPTAIPGGCRFHPRCPVVRSGEAERLGILGRCRTEDPARVPPSGDHHSACHLADA